MNFDLTWEQCKTLHAVVTRTADNSPASSAECKELRVLQGLLWGRIQGAAPNLTSRPAAKAPVVFGYHDLEKNVFIIDGKSFTPRSAKGLRWTFCVLVSHQLGDEPPKASMAFGEGSHRTTSVKALARAAEEMDRVSPPLAAAIRNIHYRGGVCVYEGRDILVKCVSNTLGVT